jgi:hypothetical protein
MNKHIFWMVFGLIVIESCRLFIPVDRLANEIQLLSATPWIYGMIKILHTLEKHIIHRRDENERS